MTKRLSVIVAAAAVATLALIPAQRAAAQAVTISVDAPEFGFRIGAPVYSAPVVVAPAPVYAPPPVVYSPPPRVVYPPVVYAPPPVVVAPRPVYVAPRPVYVAPRPVYVAPRPVYVAPRPVYVTPRPVYVAPRWTPPGHRHGHYRTGHQDRYDHRNNVGYRY